MTELDIPSSASLEVKAFIFSSNGTPSSTSYSVPMWRPGISTWLLLRTSIIHLPPQNTTTAEGYKRISSPKNKKRPIKERFFL
jgi:hypothetical protein